MVIFVFKTMKFVIKMIISTGETGVCDTDEGSLAAYVRRIAIYIYIKMYINPTCLEDFLLKIQRQWNCPRENDDFLLKNVDCFATLR